MSNPLYFVETDHGKLGTAFDGDRDYDRKRVVRDIAEYGIKAVNIFEADEDKGTWRNVTTEIAREVADHLHASRNPVSWEMANFLQAHLGVTATHSLNFARAAE